MTNLELWKSSPVGSRFYVPDNDWTITKLTEDLGQIIDGPRDLDNINCLFVFNYSDMKLALSAPEFQGFPKLSRLYREITITEKLDGTNAAVYIDGDTVLAQSRTRWITPQDDNFGFARWVNENAQQLKLLGNGRHFGEWWGEGIQRRYGIKGKRFSLFNTSRWATEWPSCCDVVPVLYQGKFCTDNIEQCLSELHTKGSVASPGFMRPEGVVIYHSSSNQSFKVTLQGDGHKNGS